jgi:DNA-directed RNA polymerase subunit L
MDKINLINYEILNYDTTNGNTRLEIDISGKNIDYVVVNTIRRYILTYVPIYIFTNFNFKKNTSVFNNNYLKLRLSNMPIWGINNNLITIDNKINNINKEDEEISFDLQDDIDMNNETQYSSTSLNEFTMYIDYTNNENNIVTVTTDQAKFYYNGNNINSPYNIPIPIVKLQPKQTITFSAISSVGIEKQSALYSAVSVCYYKEINNNKFNFIIESKGQLIEKRIIHVALTNLINRLYELKNEDYATLISNNLESSLEGEIVLLNEDNTLGNLLSHGMQQHEDVDFAGYNIPHLLENKVIIQYKLKNSKIKIQDVMTDVLTYYIKIYQNILEKNNDTPKKKNSKKKNL